MFATLKCELNLPNEHVFSLLPLRITCVCCFFLQDFQKPRAEAHAVISSAEEPHLPPEWNSSQDVYCLQYLHGATQLLCLVKAIALGDELFFSAAVMIK